jgi:hypothetical protein
MIRRTTILLLLLSTAVPLIQGFAVPACVGSRKSSSPLFASRNDDDASQPQRKSRLAGNTRDPTEEELEIMDEMITKLAAAKPYELPGAVQNAFRVVSSPRFFLRIAERTDQAPDDVERQRLQALATNLVSTLEAVVSTTEDKMDEYASTLETILKAAAEPDSGEFLVPLLPERVEAMRNELLKVDEAVLSGDGFLLIVDSWINKSYNDGMDLMVGILQKVLQMYAGRQISKAVSSETAPEKLFQELLQTDADVWDSLLRQRLKEGEVSADELLTEIQRTLESVVLHLEAGSMAQRVQAEFLKELTSRVEAKKAA